MHWNIITCVIARPDRETVFSCISYTYVLFLFNRLVSRGDGEEYIQRKKFSRRDIDKENIYTMEKTVVKLELSISRKDSAISLLRQDVDTIDICENREELGAVQLETEHTIYCAVFLCEAKKVETISLKWIQNFDSALMLNKGLNTTKKYTVFYSPNDLQKPNYRTPVLTIFSSE